MAATASQSYVRTSVHVVGLTICIATYMWVLPNITNPLHNGVGGSHQFLLTIGLTIHLLEDIFPSKPLSTLGYSSSITTTPLEILIATLYWTLYGINKKLLIPAGHGISLVPNLALHAVPAVVLASDMLVRNTAWRIQAKSLMVLDSVFFFTY